MSTEGVVPGAEGGGRTALGGAVPRRIEPFLWEIPIGYVDGMRVPGRVFASDELFKKATEDRAVQQVANVATLPGIVRASFAMPDIRRRGLTGRSRL